MFANSIQCFLTLKLPRTILLGALLLLGQTNACASDASTSVTQGVGISGGYIQGTGLTYVRYMGPNMLQVTFTGDVDQFKTDYKTGLAYSRYVHHVTQPRSLLPVSLKVIAGIDVHYQNGIIDSDVIYNDAAIIPDEHAAWFFHTGAGIGFDMWHPAKPGLMFSLVMTYALSVEEVNRQREWEISPLPAASILYNW